MVLNYILMYGEICLCTCKDRGATYFQVRNLKTLDELSAKIYGREDAIAEYHRIIGR